MTMNKAEPDLSVMEVNSIHGQFLCILQKVNFSLCWSHPPVGRKTLISLIHHNRAVEQQSMILDKKAPIITAIQISSSQAHLVHVPGRKAKWECG